jgi:hypothetical protein
MFREFGWQSGGKGAMGSSIGHRRYKLNLKRHEIKGLLKIAWLNQRPIQGVSLSLSSL